jgi:hypothetical protein
MLKKPNRSQTLLPCLLLAFLFSLFAAPVLAANVSNQIYSQQDMDCINKAYEQKSDESTCESNKNIWEQITSYDGDGNLQQVGAGIFGALAMVTPFSQTMSSFTGVQSALGLGSMFSGFLSAKPTGSCKKATVVCGGP